MFAIKNFSEGDTHWPHSPTTLQEHCMTSEGWTDDINTLCYQWWEKAAELQHGFAYYPWGAHLRPHPMTCMHP